MRCWPRAALTLERDKAKEDLELGRKEVDRAVELVQTFKEKIQLLEADADKMVRSETCRRR